ncbi:MAG TPA: class I SAM-dependent methyltransferase [Natronosporangium sp.]|nr:class I SAM-dependent methyltransferase [Natronosporangium sp.]
MGTTAHGVPEIGQQVNLLLSHAAGYVAHRTVAMGVRAGLVEALAEAGEDGLSPDELADRLGLDRFYVATWCRAAFGAGICDRSGGAYRLAPHMATLLLDLSAPAYAGGVFEAMEQPEMFTRFEQHLATGQRLWWDGCGPRFIRAVSRVGRPFYRRLVPGGLEQVPGLAERLAAGCRVLDTACGAGMGLVLLAQAYPDCELVGVDGDEFSLEVAEENLRTAGLGDRVRLVHSPMEKMTFDRPFTVVINNISMHECRDIDQVARQVRAALEPGGWFVISDFPFPDDDDGLRSVPGRVMSGIQFFEAQIDDQLLPRRVYDDLLARHGFHGIGSVSLTPMHAVTYGRA